MEENKDQEKKELNIIFDENTDEGEIEQQEENAESSKRGDHHHHHHHHHHHSHRGHHHSSKKKKNNVAGKKIAKFFKKNRSIIINVVCCLLVAAMLIFIAVREDGRDDETVSGNNSVGVTENTIQIETSIYSEKIPLVNDAVLDYIKEGNTKTPEELKEVYESDKLPYLDKGLPVRYTYRLKGIEANVTVQKAALEISESENYENARILDADTTHADIYIYNLKTGTKYYTRLTLTLSTGAVVSTCSTFETEVSPRFLNIDGAVNVRDIGGLKTLDGKTVKQGVLYRGSELDGAVMENYVLTESGLSEMKNTLGIRYDMDLRSSNDNVNGKHPLGDDIPHVYYNVGMYSNIFEPACKESTKKVFSDLANENNYPIYLHCTHGVDRTGTMCYLLEALLGVDAKDLDKEYRYSSFKSGFFNAEEYYSFKTRVNMLEGETLKDKAEGYLLSIGVTEGEIENIRKIFLED